MVESTLHTFHLFETLFVLFFPLNKYSFIATLIKLFNILVQYFYFCSYINNIVSCTITYWR